MIGDVVSAFGVGLLGSFHCLGMCGPLVLAYSLHIAKPAGGQARQWQDSIFHHVSFHTGRLLTYGFLGALAAGVVYGTEFAPFIQSIRSAGTLVAGLIMLLFGLVFVRIIPFPLYAVAATGGNYKRLGRLITSRSPFSKLLLGLGTGFLPCMLPWAMLVKAASTGDPMHGFAIMALFGLGTVPALFFTGMSASLLTARLRLVGERLAGFSIIIMGAILLFKGAKYFL